MTTYFPPEENVPIFDPYLFSSTNEYQALTVAEGNRSYLQYPFAQGTETFPANIVMNGTANTNYIQFPDGTRQYKASSDHLFQPRFVNNSNNVVGTTTGGPVMNFSGSWGNLDYAIFRVSQQISYTQNSGGFGSCSGILIVRPIYLPTISWSNDDFLGNKGSYAGPTGRGYYFLNINQGMYVYNTIYTSPLIGIQGYYDSGLAQKSLQLVNSNYLLNEIEYMGRSFNGGTVSLGNGTGTNNTLP